VQILATLSNMKDVAALVDLESGEAARIPVRPEFIDAEIKESNPCRPFGITWTSDVLYVVNNKQLLMYDRTFDYLGTHAVPVHENTHQLAFHDGFVWAVSPRTNSLIGVRPAGEPGDEFDIFRQQRGAYVPRSSSEQDDLKHVNSLLWTDSKLYIAAHNFGPSFIMTFDSASLRLVSLMQDVGGSIHGLAIDGDELFWLDTEGNAVRSSGGVHMTLQRTGFARGFAMTREHYIVAISEISDRRSRISGDAYIHVIERASGSLLAEHRLIGTGNVNDLRLLDAFDLAHGVDPFKTAAAV